jgi:hypothetical protein
MKQKDARNPDRRGQHVHGDGPPINDRLLAKELVIERGQPAFDGGGVKAGVLLHIGR